MPAPSMTGWVDGIRTDRRGATLTVTLDRPARRNALDTTMVARLLAVMGDITDDPTIRAVVLTGSPPVFCAGSDVSELAALPLEDRGAAQGFWPGLESAVRGCPVPVIAAIDGGAWGGGLFLATFADLRIASKDARFAAPEVTLGWMPPGGVEALIDLVGVGGATDLVLTGRAIDAGEALRLGLVNQIVTADALPDAAMQLADRVGALPTAGVRSARRYFRERTALERPARDRLALERFRSDITSEDADRGLARFIKH